ncbi:MAG: DUF4333 domain-containing protein [Actinomycetia bacterium]|nr:DUF4333 domain-containing protein [Actinomycetes bacterium]MCH9801090.1 DUF4333 domain-containing protein [Actinomycetes bacterium]
MRRKMVSRSAPVALGAALLMLMAGCGAATLSQDEVQTQAQQALSEQVGIEAPPINCPSDMEAKVGAEMTCTLSDGETTYEVYITVTALNDDNTANFDIQVADTPVG